MHIGEANRNASNSVALPSGHTDESTPSGGNNFFGRYCTTITAHRVLLEGEGKVYQIRPNVIGERIVFFWDDIKTYQKRFFEYPYPLHFLNPDERSESKRFHGISLADLQSSGLLDEDAFGRRVKRLYTETVCDKERHDGVSGCPKGSILTEEMKELADLHQSVMHVSALSLSFKENDLILEDIEDAKNLEMSEDEGAGKIEVCPFDEEEIKRKFPIILQQLMKDVYPTQPQFEVKAYTIDGTVLSVVLSDSITGNEVRVTQLKNYWDNCIGYPELFSNLASHRQATLDAEHLTKIGRDLKVRPLLGVCKPFSINTEPVREIEEESAEEQAFVETKDVKFFTVTESVANAQTLTNYLKMLNKEDPKQIEQVKQIFSSLLRYYARLHTVGGNSQLRDISSTTEYGKKVQHPQLTVVRLHGEFGTDNIQIKLLDSGDYQVFISGWSEYAHGNSYVNPDALALNRDDLSVIMFLLVSVFGTSEENKRAMKEEFLNIYIQEWEKYVTGLSDAGKQKAIGLLKSMRI